MKIGYVRVSDDDQTEALQIDALEAAGCDVIYGDHGVSGKITERKGLDDVLAALTEGDTLTVWKLDRLGRSTIHLLLLLDELRQRGVDFVALTQGIDTTTSAGDCFTASLHCLQSLSESRSANAPRRGYVPRKSAAKNSAHLTS